MVQKELPATTLAPTRRIISATQRFIVACQSVGKTVFTMLELRDETGLSVIAAREQLNRLKAQVVRVSPRQDFFLIVSHDQRLMGAPPVFFGGSTPTFMQ